MTGFEMAFADGERAAFEDKRAGRRPRFRPDGELTPYAKAWWLGYTPRSMVWALHKTPVKPYCEVEEA